MGRRMAWATKAFVQLAMFAAIGVLLFKRPDVFDAIVHAGLSIAAALTMLILVFIAWFLAAPDTLPKFGFRFTSPPLGFVGCRGVGIALRLVDRPQSPLRIELARRNYAIVLLLGLMLGPGFTLFVIGPLPVWNMTALPMIAGALMLTAAATCLALGLGVHHYLHNRHAIEVRSDAIVELRGSQVVKTISVDEIDCFRIEEHAFSHDDDGTTHHYINYILTLRLTDGTDERLCICGNRLQLERIEDAIRRRLHG